jgi:hypothetical protein
MPGCAHLQHAHCQATLDCDDLPAARRSSSISHACTQRVHCIREGTHLVARGAEPSFAWAARLRCVLVDYATLRA